MVLKSVVRYAAAQAVIVFILLEIVLRVYHPVVFRVRGDEIVLPINQTYRIEHAGSSKIDPVVIHTKNSLGFRGPDPPRDYFVRVRIVTIGGSTTECVNLSDGKTWTDALAQRLAPHAPVPGLWVNNAGIDGQSTFGHLVLLRTVIARLRPTIAVLLIGANDVGLEASNTFDVGTLPVKGPLRSFQNAIVEHSEVANIALNFVRAHRASRRGFGHSELDLRAAPELVLADEVMRRTIDQYRAYLPGYADRLVEIARVSRSFGTEPVFLTQPALFGDGVDPTTGVRLASVQVSGRGNGHLEWQLLEMYNDVTRRVAAGEHAMLIDLARELPKDSRYFYDFLHFTNDGAERVGEIVAAGLVSQIK